MRILNKCYNMPICYNDGLDVGHKFILPTVNSWQIEESRHPGPLWKLILMIWAKKLYTPQLAQLATHHPHPLQPTHLVRERSAWPGHGYTYKSTAKISHAKNPGSSPCSTLPPVGGGMGEAQPKSSQSSSWTSPSSSKGWLVKVQCLKFLCLTCVSWSHPLNPQTPKETHLAGEIFGKFYPAIAIGYVEICWDMLICISSPCNLLHFSSFFCRPHAANAPKLLLQHGHAERVDGTLLLPRWPGTSTQWLGASERKV